jgi:hypothetical protein
MTMSEDIWRTLTLTYPGNYYGPQLDREAAHAVARCNNELHATINVQGSESGYTASVYTGARQLSGLWFLAYGESADQAVEALWAILTTQPISSFAFSNVQHYNPRTQTFEAMS